MSGPDALVIGREGQLARSLAERAPLRGLKLEFVARPEVDLSDVSSIQAVVDASAAPVIINAAAYTAVDQAESEPEVARQVNGVAPGLLARAAAERGARLIHVSTDYVFDGRGDGYYREEDPTAPLGVYGRSKLEGEEAVRAASGEHSIVRTSWVYSPFGKNFVKTMLAAAKSRPELRVVDDQVGTPTSALDLADGLLAMVGAGNAGPGGTFHLAGPGETSWAGLARETFAISRSLGGPAADVVPIATAEWPTPAQRPLNSRLSSEKFARAFGFEIPAWQASLRTVMERLLGRSWSVPPGFC